MASVAEDIAGMGGTALAADPEQILALSQQVTVLTRAKVSDIQAITGRTRILALNAMIEAARAGDAGRGFAIVAAEVKGISQEVEAVAKVLEEQLGSQTAQLETLGRRIVAQLRGERLTDLALNAIEITDRNLYERTCDVRWWATDAAIVSCARDQSAESRAHASSRLGVILNAYTVYLDLWLVDTQGRVLANGRRERYRQVAGISVAHEEWFRQAMALRSGDEFTVADVACIPALDGQASASYATTVREGGLAHGAPIGVLAVHFAWAAQAQAIVDGVRLSPEERARTRVMLLDAKHRVLAASDRQGALNEIFQLRTSHEPRGTYVDAAGTTVSYALTPGYETYRGLGWFGCIAQRPRGV
jgi:hypothetical protein